MANRSRETDFFGTSSETAESNVVFVDTSLDTHLAMLVVKSDTVSDFKKKIALEHMHCFPKIKDIHIHSLKVKREANFYHLPDSMLVWSAFFSYEGNWFLSVDASSSSICHLNQNSSDTRCRVLSSHINMTQQTIPISLEKTTDIPNNNLSVKKKTPAKKKRKRNHTELSQDVRADQSGAVPFKVTDISAGLMDAQETAVKIQDTDTHTGMKKRTRTNSMNPANSGNGHTDVPVVEKEKDSETTNNTNKNAEEEINMKMLTTADVQEDFVEKEKDSETTDNTNKNAEEDINMKMLTTADVQEDLPVTDQKNDIGIHEASSQVPARQSEEKLEEKHEIAVKTDYLARATEEIDFKDNSVHCEVKNANQSSMEMKIMKKVKTNGLPSASISTEVQISSKLSADHKSKNKSHVRKDKSEREGDLDYNSDSSRTSSRVLENVVKDSSSSERLETNLPKPKEIIAESSILEKKNASVVKSSLEKLPGKSGNRMELTTPKKKSPSDSSSMSDHTNSESDLSQDSSRNGSSAKEQSTVGKGRSKLELQQEISIQKILRSSKRFKKAKLIAMQNEANEAALQNEANGDVENESQPIEIEFVPDSLPTM